jgi:hypothetical protein
MAGRIFRPNSLGNGRPGSNEGPDRTAGTTRGLRAGGSRGYILKDSILWYVCLDLVLCVLFNTLVRAFVSLFSFEDEKKRATFE